MFVYVLFFLQSVYLYSHLSFILLSHKNGHIQIIEAQKHSWLYHTG